MKGMAEAGIVLCGGKSSRMGSSKALLPFGSETMLQRVVRLLGEAVSPIVVVAAVDQELPALPRDVILARDEREARGPLVTSCDVPLLVPNFVRQMLDLARGYDVAVMEIDGFTHPLSAVYRRATLPFVDDLLAHDRLRPVFLFEAVKTRRVRPEEMTADPELRTLRNLNTREDYERALLEAGL
jgi:molybdopterin-guanine dinucleotide biosynthesis protein A